MSLLPPRTRFLVAAPAVVLLSACVHQSAPGVALKALPSNIVFGLKVRKAAVPPLASIQPQDQGYVDQSSTLPAQPPQPIFTPKAIPTPPVGTTNLCPPAAESAFPAVAATLGVTKPPKAGRYRWKETIVQPRGSGGLTATLTTFYDHDIINVSPVTTSQNPVPSAAGPAAGATTGTVYTFSYDEAVHHPDGSITTTTYQVKENQEQVNQVAPVGTNIGAGPPDRGLALVKVVNTDSAGKQTSAFTPVAPVLLLPLDVVSSNPFQSVGVDPTGAALVVNGTVSKRARVDACGTIVDGWEVNTTQTFVNNSASGSQAVPVDTTYYVGTQIGGLLTYTRKTLPPQFATATTPVITDSLGQLDPDPLPAHK